MKNYGEINQGIVTNENRETGDFLISGKNIYVNSIKDVNSNDLVSVVDVNNNQQFNLRNLYFNNQCGLKKKFNDNFSELRANGSFVRGQRYYLVDYITPDSSSINNSFLTTVVDAIGESGIGLGSSLTGGNVTGIELHVLSNRDLKAKTFTTPEAGQGIINKNNTVDVSNVSKVVIDGLSHYGAFETSANSSGTLDENRYRHSSNLVGNYIYVIGGEGPGAYDSSERINVANETSANSITNLSNNRKASSNLAGNHIYIVGGVSQNTKWEKINVVTETAIAPSGVLDESRYEHSSNLVGNYIYVIGGTGSKTTWEKLDVGIVEANYSTVISLKFT